MNFDAPGGGAEYSVMPWCEAEFFRTSDTAFKISSDSASSETARAKDIAPTSALNFRIAFDLAARLSSLGSILAIN